MNVSIFDSYLNVFPGSVRFRRFVSSERSESNERTGKFELELQTTVNASDLTAFSGYSLLSRECGKGCDLESGNVWE